MRRREFIAGLGGAVAWPLAARTQQATPTVGFLNAQRPEGFEPMVAAFRQGLSESGFLEDQNVRIHYRWAEGNLERVRALADELLRQDVSVIVAGGGAGTIARHLKSVPIVFVSGSDPVKTGLVSSINRPGGNATGVLVFSNDLEAKRLEMLHECVPQSAIIGILFDPTTRDDAHGLVQAFNAAAIALMRKVHLLPASTDNDIEAAFATIAQQKLSGLVVAGGPLFLRRRSLLVELVRRLQIPAIYESREFAAAGGLMSYGTNVSDVYRQTGIYAGRILKGERPAELPILLPTKFDISVNLKTAKALGIEMPTSILLRASEVIE